MGRLAFALAFAFTFAFAFAFAEETPTELEYHGPDEGTDDEWSFTEYNVGAKVWAVDGGRALSIVQQLERATVNGRHDRWYVVNDAGKETRMFGAAITSLRFEIGRVVTTVAISDDFKIHVRVAGKPDVVFDAVTPWEGRGAYVEATTKVPSFVGVPFLKVSSSLHACGGYWDAYVSFVDGIPRTALELEGLSDPPVISEPKVIFDAKKKRATVTLRSNGGDEGARMKVVERKQLYWNGSVFKPR